MSYSNVEMYIYSPSITALTYSTSTIRVPSKPSLYMRLYNADITNKVSNLTLDWILSG